MCQLALIIIAVACQISTQLTHADDNTGPHFCTCHRPMFSPPGAKLILNLSQQNLRSASTIWLTLRGKHPKTKEIRVLLYLVTILLAQDIELNPGPIQPADHNGKLVVRNPVPFPCGVCKQNVGDTHAALVCDSCDQWHHINCQGVTQVVYECLIGQEISWACISCGMPNFSTSLFSSLNMHSQNPFSTLDESRITIPSSVGSPLAALSPHVICQTQKKKRHRIGIQSIRELIVTCQSVVNKNVPAVSWLNKPHIVKGVESWLPGNIADGKIGLPDRFSS